MPCPVSFTDTRSSISSPSILFTSSLTRTYPESVYLIALLTILIITCRIFMESPTSFSGSSGVISYINSTSFSAILFKNISPRSLRTDSGSYTSSASFILPDSIFDISRISLIIARSAAPEFLIFIRYPCSCSECWYLSRISVIPTMAFIGVLIS